MKSEIMNHNNQTTNRNELIDKKIMERSKLVYANDLCQAKMKQLLMLAKRTAALAIWLIEIEIDGVKSESSARWLGSDLMQQVGIEN